MELRRLRLQRRDLPLEGRHERVLELEVPGVIDFGRFRLGGSARGSARGHEFFQATNSFLLCLFVFLFLSKRACPTDLITIVV